MTHFGLTGRSTFALICLPALMVLSACGEASSANQGGCPERAPGDVEEVEWPALIVVEGRTYVTSYGPETEVAEDAVGPVVATVRCRLEGAAASDYEPKDGDAAYLDPGTEVHALKGVDATERLAAAEGGTWTAYSATS